MTLSGGLTMPMAVRIVWMLTATTFLGGGLGIVWWPTSETITVTQSQAKALYDEANENEAAVRHATQLHALAKRIADDLRALSGQSSQSAAVAATLALLNREARDFKIEVRSIVPTIMATPAAASLSGAPIEIDVRGQFRDLLAFVSDLPRHDVLIDVSDVSLGDEDQRSLRPTLDARIHATVFRYRGTAEEEIKDASQPL